MRSEGVAPQILNLDTAWISVALPRGKGPPDTHCIAGWVGPEPIRTLWSREKFLGPAVNRTLVVQPLA
jgi:hypothetical protein